MLNFTIVKWKLCNISFFKTYRFFFQIFMKKVVIDTILTWDNSFLFIYIFYIAIPEREGDRHNFITWDNFWLKICQIYTVYPYRAVRQSFNWKILVNLLSNKLLFSFSNKLSNEIFIFNWLSGSAPRW